MSNFKVTKEFAADFDLVSKHYGCTAGEIEEMKQCARNDMENAVISFAAMAREIVGMLSAEGAA